MAIITKLRWTSSFAALGLALLAACSGGGGGGSYGSGGGDGGNPGVAPMFMSQPSAATVNAGQPASFSATAMGTPDPTQQWERSADGISWNPVPGATSATYSFSAAKADHAAQYRARASNSYGSATSSPAGLTVHWAPAITTHPVNQSVNSPNPAVFSMDMDCNPDASSQWQNSADGISWQDIPGATGPSFNTGPTSAAMNNMKYRCVCTNVVGSSTTNAATLIVDVPVFALTTNLGAGTTGSPASGGSFAAGSVVNYSYAPLAGYTNLKVLLDGGVVASSGSVTMDSAHTLAVSAAPIQRTVLFSAGAGGTLAGTLVQTVSNGGGTAPVTAVPDSGFSFVSWTGNGFATSTANPLVIASVLQDLTLTANFTPAAPSFTITASAGIYGSVSPSGAVTVPAGGNQTFSITAAAYYSIGDVMVDGVSVGAVSSYTFTNVTGNHTISATFI